MLNITWQWIVNQIFAFIGLVFVVFSFQQKSTKKLLLLRNFATGFVFIGLCFLGNISAIIFCGAGVIRNLVSLYFAYKTDTKKIIKYIASILIVLLLIVLNVIYWKNLYNLYSIVLGTIALITFMQEKSSTIRKLSVVSEILSITYYALLLSPTNVVIEVVGLVSVIVGIIRLDINKKSEHRDGPFEHRDGPFVQKYLR